MMSSGSTKWLLLIHQIPPKPNSFRVKIWRRLQRSGAVAIKQSVYAMPSSDQSREDFTWILREIVAGGGDGSISEVLFLEGLTDDQIVALFQNARKQDYERLIQDTNGLISMWSSEPNDSHESLTKGAAQLARLRSRLTEITSIDFFEVPERGIAEILLREAAGFLADQKTTAIGSKAPNIEIQGKTWVTRRNIFVDRMACGWLIRRFIDKESVFKFVAGQRYAPEPGEVRFDMFEGDYTHEGEKCTFETMIDRFQIQEKSLVPLAEIVHDIDLKEGKYLRSEADGFHAILIGLTACEPDDCKRMEEGFLLFDKLYRYFQRQEATASSETKGTRTTHTHEER